MVLRLEHDLQLVCGQDLERVSGEIDMAGHSKWANIQHRKGRQDAKRGKVFTRLIKEITVASRKG